MELGFVSDFVAVVFAAVFVDSDDMDAEMELEMEEAIDCAADDVEATGLLWMEVGC